jgi:hypothetical protein
MTFAALLLDLRYDHNHVLRKHPYAWVPIIYSGLMFVAGLIGLAAWDTWGRQALMVLFAAGFVVGVLGYYFHSGGHLLHPLRLLFSVWGGKHPDPVEKPPVLAPLSFAGLGALGLLACSNRFQSPPPAGPAGP